jgi:hypothetical protein
VKVYYIANTMGQRIGLSRKEERQEQPVVMMRMMALTVPRVSRRRMGPTPLGVQQWKPKVNQYR